jgi:hypothetical protein
MAGAHEEHHDRSSRKAGILMLFKMCIGAIPAAAKQPGLLAMITSMVERPGTPVPFPVPPG